MSVIEKVQRELTTYRDLLLTAPAPSQIKRFLFSVNGWCNSKCSFCNIWQYDKRKAQAEEITLDELERHVFSSVALKEVLNIGITGGEPFLRRDLAEVVDSMYRHFPKAEIGAVTNAIRYERVVEISKQIMAAHPQRIFSIAISLDGYAETHDRVRGVPGNFERILKCIELLRAEVPAVLIGFSHTVTPISMQDSLRCYQLARELGVGFMYRLAHESPYLRNDSNEPIWDATTLAAARPIVAELNRQMLADQSLRAKVANIHYAQNAFYHQMMDYFENPRRTFDCFSGTHSFLLNHDGEVYPCINLPTSMGNLRQQHFDAIWYAPKAEAVREPIRQWQCHCWTNCETEFSLARDRKTFLNNLGLSLQSSLAGRGQAALEIIPLETFDRR